MEAAKKSYEHQDRRRCAGKFEKKRQRLANEIKLVFAYSRFERAYLKSAETVYRAAKLEAAGFSVDFTYPWDKVHSGDYDLAELFARITAVCR